VAGLRSGAALELFAFSAVLYHRSLSAILAMRDRRVRRLRWGELLLSSLVVESYSALLSLIMMLIQSRFDRRFPGATRLTRRRATMSASVHPRCSHWLHTLVGIGAGVLAYSISWTTFLWFLPIVAGLVLSIPISWASGRMGLGVAAYYRNIFRIPEERAPVSKTDDAETPATVRRLEAAE
jgi:membrane glycosyltransferase